MSLAVRAPLAGTVVMLDDVPDPVFANRIIGPGLAIDPDRSHGTATATAPISGILSKVHPHAYVTVSPEGRSVLVHLGLDTVELGGQGFTVHAVEGGEIAAGEPIITWSPATIEASGHNPIVPVIALGAAAESLTSAPAGETLTRGAVAFTWG